MKQCFKCHTMKPLDEFYAHPQMADGHLNKCKACTRRDVIRRHRTKREQIQAPRRAYERSEKGHASSRARYARYRLRHPEKVRARAKAAALAKQPCEECGAEKSEAHHEDYGRPLDVNWFCRPHHREVHMKKEGLYRPLTLQE